MLKKTDDRIRSGFGLRTAVELVFIMLLLTAEVVAAMPASVKGVYLPAHSITSRRIAEVIHYAGQLGINAVVLHVKDPYGRIAWTSKLELA
ncbi:putative glycoside hydrolase, partial [Patescibacteria group bacterium]|nr:putative glycoside hydrolase [Patescibacteria group bacterium]